MICSTCRRTLLLRLRAPRDSPLQLRSVATVTSTSSTAPAYPPSSILLSGTPANSSSSPGTLQPLSTTHVPTIKPTSKPVELKGSVAGGQELRGLGYLKGKPNVLAKEDDEYPDWLWTLLDAGRTGEVKVDLNAMTKKQRHKHDRKQERLMKNLPKQIPLHEQSKDLTGPSDDAVASLDRRQEITKSARVARRKGIRESNFLRGV